MNQTLIVNVPSELYVRIKKRADEAHRSVEDEAVVLLQATVPTDLDQSLASLQLLDNAGLEKAARSRLADDVGAELETLHFKQQREGLSTTESTRCAELVRALERAMLVRANAAVLLKQRGVDVSHLVTQP
jgi:plasmid stability protein